MADTAIAVTQGAGTSIDTRTEATNGNHRQVIVIGDPSLNAGVAPVDGTNGLSVNITNASLPATHTDTAPATANITAQDLASSTASGANSQSFITGTPTAGSAASFTLSGINSVNVMVSGTWTGTLVNEVSIDGGTTWFTRGIHQTGTSYTTSSYTANFSGIANTAGFTNYRLRSTAAWTGTAVVKVIESTNIASTYVINSIRIADSTTPTQTLSIDSTGALAVQSGGSTGSAVPSRAIQFAGSDGTNLRAVSVNTSGQIISAAAKTEDAASSSGDVGELALFVRNDTGASLTSTDLDYGAPTVDSAGRSIVTLGTLLSGEDTTNSVFKVEHQFSYQNITTNATTTVKSGAGLLHGIVINTKGASANVLTIYDNTAASGTKIGTVDTVNGVIGTIRYDAKFTTGLTILTATGTAADVTVIYR
jgi:hypothetical protein